jgi:hypothetical protein
MVVLGMSGGRSAELFSTNGFRKNPSCDFSARLSFGQMANSPFEQWVGLSVRAGVRVHGADTAVRLPKQAPENPLLSRRSPFLSFLDD